VLARLRVKDREAGTPEAECGWRSRQELWVLLNVSPEKMNLDLHRARRLLASKGVRGVERLLDRRSDAGMLRLGLSNIALRGTTDP
jgi:hypothetical protein